MNSDENENHPKTIKYNFTNFLDAKTYINVIEVSAHTITSLKLVLYLICKDHIDFRQFYCVKFALISSFCLNCFRTLIR